MQIVLFTNMLSDVAYPIPNFFVYSFYMIFYVKIKRFLYFAFVLVSACTQVQLLMCFHFLPPELMILLMAAIAPTTWWWIKDPKGDQ